MKRHWPWAAALAITLLLPFQNCGQLRSVQPSESQASSVGPIYPSLPGPLPAPTPIFKILTPNPGEQSYNGTELRGTCVPGSTIKYNFGGATGAQSQVCPSGTFDIPLTLPATAGAKTLQVTQINANGAADSSDTRVVYRVNRCSMAGATVAASPFILLSVSSMAEKSVTGALASDGAWRFDYHGGNAQDVVFPQTGYYAFRAVARGTFVDTGIPKMQISVDGRVVSETDVSSAALTTYASETAASSVEAFPISAGTHKVTVGFNNWAHSIASNVYQNLYVKSLAIHTATLSCAASPVPPDLSTTTLSSLAAARGLRVGAAMLNAHLTESDYKATALKQFNHMIPENEFQMTSIAKSDGVFDFSVTDAMVNFAQQNGMTVTATHLVWHASVPQWLINKNPTAQQTKDFLQSYITAIMSRYKGKVKYWVVVNEAVSDVDGETLRTDSFWYQKLGADYIKTAFQMARAADPSAILIYNDYQVEEAGRKPDILYNLMSTYKAQGIPIDEIGFQAHLNVTRPFFYTAYVQNLKRFATLGYKLQVTELDVAMALPSTPVELAMQAQFYRNAVKGCLQVPECGLISTWGITDKYWWLNSAMVSGGLMLDANYAAKPAYNAVVTVLYGLDP